MVCLQVDNSVKKRKSARCCSRVCVYSCSGPQNKTTNQELSPKLVMGELKRVSVHHGLKYNGVVYSKIHPRFTPPHSHITIPAENCRRGRKEKDAEDLCGRASLEEKAREILPSAVPVYNKIYRLLQVAIARYLWGLDQCWILDTGFSGCFMLNAGLKVNKKKIKT
ncbi:hypothetical protein G9C98_008434 [Cotesia typhae]|uniref:Uncharacterized protein n=1 Tax=Cotesia typhae TaxID=2053667 RepID=A0A8J5QW59_9HYME|nr:hypothetical protein G9C98_008434 [Cotesia typhae]